jgi:hypothetical protein
MSARKTARRTWLIEEIIGVLKKKITFERINYKNLTESDIRTSLYYVLLEGLEGIHAQLTPTVSQKRIKLKADRSLLWESDPRSTINNFLFLGAQHRPDYEIQIFDLLIAIEIKRGKSGQTVREGLGQSLVYSNKYDFVVYLYVDTSTDKKILKSLQGAQEEKLLETLWQHHNICVDVV